MLERQMLMETILRLQDDQIALERPFVQEMATLIQQRGDAVAEMIAVGQHHPAGVREFRQGPLVAMENKWISEGSAEQLRSRGIYLRRLGIAVKALRDTYL